MERKYRELLGELQQTLDQTLGPLDWNITETPQQLPLYLAAGVDVPNIDREELTLAVNSALNRFGFPIQPLPEGSPSGHLIFEASDARGVTLRIMIKMGIDMWLILPKS